jgi:hypothetical protein
MTDQELMYAIKQAWGAAIEEAAKASSVPPAWLAALIANESGGKADAKRFEKNVLVALWEVLLGRKAAYGTIGRADVVRFVSGISPLTAQVPASLPTDTYQRLDGLATSWGLTQIMGYHVFEFNCTLDDLKTPARSLEISMRLAAQFVARNQLDVRDTKDLGELFDCWNTGRPDGVTFDPNYVTNGLARMELYSALG